jgi:ATP-binding cassette subfamily C (CFTR/MRP) protein 1
MAERCSFLILAVLRAQNSHLMDQVSYYVRGYLIYRIHARSVLPVDHRVVGGNESAKVTVLATVDVANAASAFKSIFEVPACAITVGVGAYLLFQVAGLAFLGPLFLALLSLAVPVLLGRKLARSQKRVLEATEKRLRAMSQLVSNTRSIRVGGVQGFAADEALSCRQLEIGAASLYRKVFIIVICSGECNPTMNNVGLLT